MLKLLRTVLYALLVLGSLSSVTYLLYFAPGPMERRVAAELGKYLREKPKVRGAARPWMGPLTIREIEVPAAPIVDRRYLLLLHDLEIDTAGGDWSEAGALPRPAGGGLSVRVQRGELFLDHELEWVPSGEAGSRLVWNFRDALRSLEALGHAAGQGHRVAVEELLVEVQAVRRRQQRSSWSAAVQDLLVEGRTDGSFEVRGELPAGAYWSDGRFTLRWRPGATGATPALQGQLSIDNLKGLDEWLAALFSSYPRARALLSPEGPVTLQVISLNYSPWGPSGRGGTAGSLDYRATIRHYDTRLRVAPFDVELRHVTGVVSLGPGGLVLGEAEGDEASGLSGEIWGAPVFLLGRLRPLRSEIQIRVPEVDLETAGVSAQSEALASLWRRLRPSGFLQGTIDLLFGDGPLLSWRVAGSFRDLACGDLPFLGSGTGKIALRSDGVRGSGLVEIASARCEPLGDLRGVIPVSWTARELSLEPEDLYLGGGRLRGRLTRAAPEGTLAGSLRLEGSTLSYAEGLLTASSVGGKLELSSSGGELGGSVRLELVGVRLQTDRLPTGDFRPAEEDWLKFEEGEVTATLTPEGARPVRIAFRGKNCALRFLGSIEGRGDLDGVALVAVGDPAQELNRLGIGSAPREWRRAVEDRGLGLRVRGGGLRCRLRRVTWSDPAFQE